MKACSFYNTGIKQICYRENNIFFSLKAWKSVGRGADKNKLLGKALRIKLIGCALAIFLIASAFPCFLATGRHRWPGFNRGRGRGTESDKAKGQQNSDNGEKSPIFLLHIGWFGDGTKVARKMLRFPYN